MTCNWCKEHILPNEPTVKVEQKVFHEVECIGKWRSHWKEVIYANLRIWTPVARMPN